MEKRGRRQHGGKQLFAGSRIDLKKKPFRNLSLLRIRIQQDSFLLVHAAHRAFHPALRRPLQKQGQGRVDPSSEHGMDHGLRISGAVPEMFHKNGPFIGKGARGRDLPLQIARRQIGRRLRQPKLLQRIRQALLLCRRRVFLTIRRVILPGRPAQIPEHPPKGFPCPLIPSPDLSLPEGKTGSLCLRARHHHPILVNGNDFPAEGAQKEAVSCSGLENKFFIHLSQLHAFLGLHRIQAPVRDGASRRHRQQAAVAVSLHPLMDAVVQDSGADGNLPVMLIVSGEHGTDVFHVLLRHVPKGPGAGKHFHHLIQRVASCRRHGYQMLGKNIQTAGGRLHPFDSSFSGQLRRHAAGHAFRRRSGKENHLADPAGIVSRPAKPLHGSGNGTGTAHLQHLVDLPHINAQLHGGGGTEKPQPAGAQILLHLLPLLL